MTIKLTFKSFISEDATERAWHNTHRKGSQAQIAKLHQVHAKNPKFQSFIQQHGYSPGASVKQASKAQTVSKEVAAKRAELSNKAYGATKGTKVGGEHNTGAELRDTVKPLSRDQHSSVEAAKREAKAKEAPAKPAKPAATPATKPSVSKVDRLAMIKNIVNRAKRKQRTGERYEVPNIEHDHDHGSDYSMSRTYKEEVEQIDELRNANLGNYLKRTGTNKPKPETKQEKPADKPAQAKQVDEASMTGMPFTTDENKRMADAGKKVTPKDLEVSLNDIPGRLGRAPRGSKALADMSDIKLANKLTKEEAEQIEEKWTAKQWKQYEDEKAAERKAKRDKANEFKKHDITTEKRDGDDAYSHHVLHKGKSVVSGLHKTQVKHYMNRVLDKVKEKHASQTSQVKEEAEQIEERNKENAIKRKNMDASRGARYKLNNPVPPAEPEHKTAVAHNKAIGRAIRNEEVEQIDELDRNTVASYAGKAAGDMFVKGSKAEAITRGRNITAALAVGRKADVREKGIKRAVKNLANPSYGVKKEEVEQIDELKDTTLKSYKEKAAGEIASDADKKSYDRNPNIAKRIAGVKLANKKLLNKEEVEQYVYESLLEEGLKHKLAAAGLAVSMALAPHHAHADTGSKASSPAATTQSNVDHKAAIVELGKKHYAKLQDEAKKRGEDIKHPDVIKKLSHEAAARATDEHFGKSSSTTYNGTSRDKLTDAGKKAADKVDSDLSDMAAKSHAKLKEGFNDPKAIAAELVKRHGKGVTKKHIDALHDEMDTHQSLDHDEIMHHVKKLTESLEEGLYKRELTDRQEKERLENQKKDTDQKSKQREMVATLLRRKKQTIN